jgi:prepilin-type N-terminal cleavage/methylation domain-containing protein
MNNRSLQGFTLSELLVSLAVLGLIAAFAIPKVLTAVGESSSRAMVVKHLV